jgi:hypothetical protein
MRREIEEKVPHYAGFRRLLKTVFQRDDDALDALGTELPWLSVSR